MWELTLRFGRWPFIWLRFFERFEASEALAALPLREALKAALHASLPASATAKACHYTLALWNKLTRFLDHPQLELSNNLAENSMR